MNNGLTEIQNKLVNDLINEFTKMNKTAKVSTDGRFSINSINEIIKEEETFLNNIKKHNLTMIKAFSKEFDKDIKAFQKEYKDILKVELGYLINKTTLKNGYAEWLEMALNNPLDNKEYYETQVFLVSKTILYKRYFGSNSQYDYFNGKYYTYFYVDFNRVKVKHTLKSGKEISAFKVIGLEYRLKEYLRKESCQIASSLDELIQNDKEFQRKIIDLVQ